MITRLIHLRSHNHSVLLDFMRRELGSFNETLIPFGAVYVNGIRVTEPRHLLREDDIVRVHLEPKRYPAQVDDIEARVLFEDENFLVVDKPSGLPMHPTLDNLHENLFTVLSKKRVVYLTHRLDVLTSGLVVFGKTPLFQAEFNELLGDRGVIKIYRALVEQPIPLGIMKHFMMVSVKAPRVVVRSVPLLTTERWQECVLEVVGSKQVGILHELLIELRTGRTHQIRAQLACEGAPIVGDEMYGGRQSEGFGLHASYLSFTCPVTDKSFSFDSDPAFVRPQ